MTDSILSSLSETCTSCDKLAAENRKLKQRLANALENEGQLQILKKVKKELRSIELLASQYNIEIGDLAQSLTFALDQMFAIKSKTIVERGKEAVQLVKRLFEGGLKYEESVKEESSVKEQNPQPEVKPQKKKSVEKVVFDSNFSNDDSVTQKIEKKKESPSLDPKYEAPTQKQAPPSIFDEMNSYRKKVEKIQSPYIPKEPTPKSFPNLDEEQQKLSMLDKSSHEDISLPLNWEIRTFFDTANKCITKRYNDIYKKICTENALPRNGRHRVKMQMVNKGTVAIGIVTEAYKNQGMIDDRKCDAVKYLSFQNGGGLVKFCGEEIMGGPTVHLRVNQVLEIVFNADKLEVTFSNPNLQRPLEVRLTDRFKNKNLYFFLEMKQCNTSVRFL